MDSPWLPWKEADGLSFSKPPGRGVLLEGRARKLAATPTSGWAAGALPTAQIAFPPADHGPGYRKNRSDRNKGGEPRPTIPIHTGQRSGRGRRPGVLPVDPGRSLDGPPFADPGPSPIRRPTKPPILLDRWRGSPTVPCQVAAPRKSSVPGGVGAPSFSASRSSPTYYGNGPESRPRPSRMATPKGGRTGDLDSPGPMGHRSSSITTPFPVSRHPRRPLHASRRSRRRQTPK